MREYVGMSVTISQDQKHRYVLSRVWGSAPPVMFVMLNPSTADGIRDDATVRKCVGFAEKWGYGGIIVCNLFAFRSRDPGALITDEDVVGPENDRWLRQMAMRSGRVVCAWGAFVERHPDLMARTKQVRELLRNNGFRDLYCLGKTKGGQPRHPLMLSYKTPMTVWEG